jgi:hypothetical protein
MKVEPKSRKILTLKIPLHLRPRPKKALPPAKFITILCNFITTPTYFITNPALFLGTANVNYIRGAIKYPAVTHNAKAGP